MVYWTWTTLLPWFYQNLLYWCFLSLKKVAVRIILFYDFIPCIPLESKSIYNDHLLTHFQPITNHINFLRCMCNIYFKLLGLICSPYHILFGHLTRGALAACPCHSKSSPGHTNRNFFPVFFFFFNSHDELHEQGGIACSLNNNQAVVK